MLKDADDMLESIMPTTPEDPDAPGAANPEIDNDTEDPNKPNPGVSDKTVVELVVAIDAGRLPWQHLHDVRAAADRAIAAEESRALELV